MRGDPRLEIGGVARAHGIRGEVVVHTHDPDSEVLGAVETIYVDGVVRRIESARGTQRGWLVKLEGVTTRNDAEALAGQTVEVDRTAVAMEDGDVLLDDLVGCTVTLPDGTSWGEVVAIDIGPQDRLVIHDVERKLERLYPLVDALIEKIDLDAGVIVVTGLDGLPADPIA